MSLLRLEAELWDQFGRLVDALCATGATGAADLAAKASVAVLLGSPGPGRPIVRAREARRRVAKVTAETSCDDIFDVRLSTGIDGDLLSSWFHRRAISAYAASVPYHRETAVRV